MNQRERMWVLVLAGLVVVGGWMYMDTVMSLLGPVSSVIGMGGGPDLKPANVSRKAYVNLYRSISNSTNLPTKFIGWFSNFNGLKSDLKLNFNRDRSKLNQYQQSELRYSYTSDQMYYLIPDTGVYYTHRGSGKAILSQLGLSFPVKTGFKPKEVTFGKWKNKKVLKLTATHPDAPDYTLDVTREEPYTILRMATKNRKILFEYVKNTDLLKNITFFRNKSAVSKINWTYENKEVKKMTVNLPKSEIFEAIEFRFESTSKKAPETVVLVNTPMFEEKLSIGSIQWKLSDGMLTSGTLDFELGVSGDFGKDVTGSAKLSLDWLDSVSQQKLKPPARYARLSDAEIISTIDRVISTDKLASGKLMVSEQLVTGSTQSQKAQFGGPNATDTSLASQAIKRRREAGEIPSSVSDTQIMKRLKNREEDQSKKDETSKSTNDPSTDKSEERPSDQSELLSAKTETSRDVNNSKRDESSMISRQIEKNKTNRRKQTTDQKNSDVISDRDRMKPEGSAVQAPEESGEEIIYGKKDSFPRANPPQNFVQARKSFNSGDYEDAKNRLKKLYERYPKSANVNYLLGVIYFEEENFDMARKYLKTAAQLEHDPQIVEWSKDYLSRMDDAN